jgi:prepilin-type N-terminal cleavage/methylation domain-containing protein
MKNNKRAFSLIEISIVILIIGILIAGVTQSSRLVSQARINSARTITESSPVSSVKGLSLWIETASEASFDDSEANDGSTITNWYDINPQVSNKAHFTQATTANKPVYKTKIINSLPAIKFDGAATFMTSANFSNITTGAATVFVVVQLPSALAVQTIINKQSATGTNFSLQTTAAAGEGWQYLDDTAAYGATLATNVQTSSTYILSAVYTSNSALTTNSTATGISFFKDGATAGQLTTAGNSPNTTITGQLTLGAVYDASAPFGGYIGEVIVYDRAIKKEERQAVEEYLGKKWGISMTVAAY